MLSTEVDGAEIAPTEWMSMSDMPIGDHRFIPLLARGPDGQQVPAHWNGTLWIGHYDGQPLPFQPTAYQRLPVTYSADTRLTDGAVALTIYVSVDPGPMKAFAPISTIRLDEAHATELLGSLMLSLQRRRGEGSPEAAPADDRADTLTYRDRGEH